MVSGSNSITGRSTALQIPLNLINLWTMRVMYSTLHFSEHDGVLSSLVRET